MFGAVSVAYKEAIKGEVADEWGPILSVLLIIVAAIVLLIALLPGHRLLKAGVLLWITLP